MPSDRSTSTAGLRQQRDGRGDLANRQIRRERRQRRRRRRALIGSSLAIVGLLAATAYGLDALTSAGSQAAEQEPSPSPPAQVLVEPAPVLSATEPAPVLMLPGLFPVEGPGTFVFATEPSEVLGETGQLLQYRVAVEEGTDEDLAEFAEFAAATLGDPRGWSAGGDLRFQQVPDGAPSDFTIYLATSATTAALCAQGGLDVIGGGLPEGGVSCRLPGQVVLNLHRWRLSVPHYVDEQVPLEVYRQMVFNHEVGHQLGFDHEGCPEPGAPAPVMQQQSLLLDGCQANPWPYVDGRRHTGPPVP